MLVIELKVDNLICHVTCQFDSRSKDRWDYEYWCLNAIDQITLKMVLVSELLLLDNEIGKFIMKHYTIFLSEVNSKWLKI